MILAGLASNVLWSGNMRMEGKREDGEVARKISEIGAKSGKK